MKKFYFLIFLAAFVSCSTGDEDNLDPAVSNEEPIIGKWKIVKMTEYPSNANPIVTTYGECFRRSRAVFLFNGNIEETMYDEDSNGNCEERVFENQTIISHTWQKISENKYRFTQEIISYGDTHVSSRTPESVSFPISNTMEMMWMGNNRYENDPIKVEYYVNTYQRVP